MERIDGLSWLGWLASALAALAMGCSVDGGSLADSGGTSGTGISQGAITAFGSIFVNGVEWSLEDASIEVDGAPADESALRRGMVVRVEGDQAAGGLSGTAVSVVFDDDLEGPIADEPVTIGTASKRFTVLDTTVIVHAARTVFDDGASFDSLARDQVVEVSGFADEQGRVMASRIALVGSFPAVRQVERRGRVSNLFEDGVGGGIFDLDAISVRYTAATSFENGRRAELANGQQVEVEGLLRMSGDEIDASRIEFEDPGFDEDFEDFEIEGVVAAYQSDGDFRVSGVPVDASSAAFEPADLALASGVQVEIGGRLENGVLIADRVRGQGDDDPDAGADRVRISAVVSAVRSNPRGVTIAGVDVSVGGDAELQDDRDGLPNFRLGDVAPGDWLEVEAIATGAATARARKIQRRAAEEDVVLQGPVTDLDPDAPGLEVLGLPIALDALTSYRDVDDQPRSEEEFFRSPGDVMIDDVVRVTDEAAVDPAALGVADVVEIEAGS